MRKAFFVLVALAVSFLGLAQAVLVQVNEQSIALTPEMERWPTLSGTVRYQGPVFSPEEPNWKPAHSYTGIPLSALVDALGGMGEEDLLSVIAVDGYHKELPWAVVYGDSPLGSPILAFAQDGVLVPDWQEGPMLVFLTEDGEVSNEDQLSALGELAHYFQDKPSATGLMVKAVTWLVVNWDGTRENLPEVGLWPPEATLTVAAPEERTYTLGELETSYVAVTGLGTYTTSAGRDVTYTWTGIPLVDLIGSRPADTEVELVAADGYRMPYRYGDLSDAEGVWSLAFKQDGKYMPFDPGYFRMVKIGPENPHFESSRSARMVVRVEVHGIYEPYTLRLSGAVERTFSREELEAGVGCPCHTSTVTSTSKGETHTYTGLPLWRLLAYVDDERFPPAERGIFYDDADFNDKLAQAGYLIEIRAADGYSQTISSTVVAHDDRFIIALKRDGRFLTAEEGGPLLFVWDDSAPAPDGLKKVKWVAEIVLNLSL
jgi:hypothetical protein